MFNLKRVEFVILFVLILLSSVQKIQAGEPVPGAEIYIELEPDDEPIANVITNEEGEFEITIPNNGQFIPDAGNFIFTIKPPKKFASENNLAEKKLQKIKIKFNKANDGKI